VLVLLLPVFLNQLRQTIKSNRSQETHARAAIVDHLSISQPNQVFVKECSSILEKAGYSVDYYRGGDVTVEFYRNLPTYGYDLIVFRVHSSYVRKQRYASLALYTSEPYSTTRYVFEQLRDEVARGWLAPTRKGDPYLVVNEKFVLSRMKGIFKDTIIIMMGCSGIKQNVMAGAFYEKGAKAYIGWDGPVSASYTDRATIRLLKHLLVEKQPIARSVEKTMEEVGYESQHKSRLLYWPIKKGDLIIQPVHSKTTRRNITPET
jgi:hypothetical protein